MIIYLINNITMSIIVRLVGNFINEKNESFMYELKINNIKLISYDSIKSHLISLSDFDEEKFDFINIRCDDKDLKSNSIENIFEEEKRVWLHCAKKEIRQEVIDIFENNGYKFITNTNTNINCDTNNINDNDSDSESEIDIDFIDIEQKTLPDCVNVDEVNQETIKLFEDPDFVKLFQIYLHKPVLFKKFYMYISNGNIPNNLELTNNSNNNEPNQLFIKNLNLGFTDEQIVDALIKTNNHLNFSIRYLLYKKYESI